MIFVLVLALVRCTCACVCRAGCDSGGAREKYLRKAFRPTSAHHAGACEHEVLILLSNCVRIPGFPTNRRPCVEGAGCCPTECDMKRTRALCRSSGCCLLMALLTSLGSMPQFLGVEGILVHCSCYVLESRIVLKSRGGHFDISDFSRHRLLTRTSLQFSIGRDAFSSTPPPPSKRCFA